ncbi:MAG: RNHCP domain-containing protein [Chloroflexi bacterium]|nr:RNHCP domain-containing protein [Chloroflexota bacterium]
MARPRPAAQSPRWSPEEQPFRCGQCGLLVEPLLSGGRHRNHCPRCLTSRHVDARTPGDRRSACGGLMPAVARLTRRTGEHVIVHHCARCGAERRNRLAADDNLGLLLALPSLETGAVAALPPDAPSGTDL